MRTDSRRKIHKDNAGSAMVMVMVAIALIGLLVSILMFVSYAGYQMRLTDKQGKNTFYTAETVLDEINVGLQEEISLALSEAYVDLMSNYGLYETPEMRRNRLYTIYYDKLRENLCLDAMHKTEYNIDKLRGYLTEAVLGDGTDADGSIDHFGTYGAVVESDLTPAAYALVLSETGITLKDLKVTYVDESGFVSIISTDIKIVLPSVSFAQSSAFPDLNKYAMIADQGLKIYNTRSGGSVNIFGDIYAGNLEVGLESGAVSAAVNLKKADDIPDDAYSRVVSRETLAVGGNMTLNAEDIELWSRDIRLDGGSLSLSGVTNVQDDLTMQGAASRLVIEGEYNGYGVSESDEAQSSAIVVNGKNSVLDLSNTEILTLGGHAYVSTAYTEQEGDAPNAPERQNQNNVFMGESIAVKSSQLVYLVPPECLGCKIEASGLTGNSKYYRNPLTREQYQEIFVDQKDQFVQIDVKRSVAALGGKTLEDYMVQEDVAGSGEKQYVPEVIFKQTNTGTLVYCYMRFKNEEAANAYFRDYYNVNGEEVDKYTRLYAKEIKVRDPESMTSYHLAGNILAYDETGAGSLIRATDAHGQKQQAELASLTRMDMFRALNAKLVTNLAQLSPAEQSRGVFENVIDSDSMDAMITALDDDHDGEIIIYNADGTKKALLTKNNYIVSQATPGDIYLIICKGNVTVKTDYQGLIIASGTITVNDTEDTDGQVELLNISLEDFTELMLSKETKESKDYYVLDVFRDGKNYAFSSGTAKDLGTRQVDLADLIRYERWSKK